MKFLDIYVLLEEFDNEMISLFFRDYLYGFEPASTYYEYPQYGDNPQFETDSVDEMLGYLMSEGNVEYCLYWRNPQGIEIYNGMIFFCSDNSLIIGLSISSEKENIYLNELKEKFRSEYGIVSFEELPPLNSKDFKEIACK